MDSVSGTANALSQGPRVRDWLTADTRNGKRRCGCSGWRWESAFSYCMSNEILIDAAVVKRLYGDDTTHQNSVRVQEV
jgi:hypothetical protein